MHGSPLRRRLTFVAITATALTVWIVVLPWVARQPAMSRHLSELERQGIDGGATFYTELEMMDRILHPLER